MAAKSLTSVTVARTLAGSTAVTTCCAASSVWRALSTTPSNEPDTAAKFCEAVSTAVTTDFTLSVSTAASS